MAERTNVQVDKLAKSIKAVIKRHRLTTAEAVGVLQMVIIEESVDSLVTCRIIHSLEQRLVSTEY